MEKTFEVEKNEAFSAELFNISQEFEDLRIELDIDGGVVMGVFARRC